MSRPKGSKNKSTLAKESKSKATTKIANTEKEVITTPASNELISSTSTKSRYPLCQLCHKEIYSSPRTIRLTEMTGVAYYHREVEDVYKICDECAKDLSEYVEKWLIKKGAKKRVGYL